MELIEEKDLIGLVQLQQKKADVIVDMKCVVRCVEIICPDTNKKTNVWRMEFKIMKKIRGEIEVKTLHLYKRRLEERFFKRLNGVEKFARKVGIEEFTVITKITTLA